MALVPELEQLYRRYKTELYRYLCGLTHDPAEAEDLLSETFLRVLPALARYTGKGSVRGWLYGIARNTWLESLRKRRPTVSLDDMLELYVEDGKLGGGARQTLARVRELLQTRPERERLLVELRAQGYAYAEIAQRLHITENTARVAEHRARAWLKARLQEEGYTDV